MLMRRSLWPHHRSVTSPVACPDLTPLVEVETDVVLPRLAESDGDGGVVLGSQAGCGHRPPERVPDQRSPEFLLSEVVVVPAVDWVYLHVDVAKRTDGSQVSRPQVSHLQLSHGDHRGRVELTRLYLVD